MSATCCCTGCATGSYSARSRYASGALSGKPLAHATASSAVGEIPCGMFQRASSAKCGTRGTRQTRGLARTGQSPREVLALAVVAGLWHSWNKRAAEHRQIHHAWLHSPPYGRRRAALSQGSRRKRGQHHQRADKVCSARRRQGLPRGAPQRDARVNCGFHKEGRAIRPIQRARFDCGGMRFAPCLVGCCRRVEGGWGTSHGVRTSRTIRIRNTEATQRQGATCIGDSIST